MKSKEKEYKEEEIKKLCVGGGGQSCVAQPRVTRLFVTTDISRHNAEVVRNHQTEESGSVELRNAVKAYSFSERIFWHFDTRTIESHFPAW